MKIEISTAARDDLLAHFVDGVLRFGVRQAEAFQKDLDAKFRLIAAHPEIGPLWEQNSPFRKLSHFPYVILYTIHEDAVRIERVIDGRADFPE